MYIKETKKKKKKSKNNFWATPPEGRRFNLFLSQVRNFSSQDAMTNAIIGKEAEKEEMREQIFLTKDYTIVTQRQQNFIQLQNLKALFNDF